MISSILRAEWRFLTFRGLGPDVQSHGGAYLAFGLVFTWLAGLGRYWDNPRAEPWQLLGFGSLAYVVVLAALLWLVALPLEPRRWSYRNVLLFVALTAPPAVLYAIPVERFLTADAARSANAWFLAVVATWRVALLLHFLRTVAALSWPRAIVALLLPLIAIVLALTVLNLEHVVFDLMSGTREADRSGNDAAYTVVVLVTVVSIVLAPFVVAAYAALAYSIWKDRRASRASTVG